MSVLFDLTRRTAAAIEQDLRAMARRERWDSGWSDWTGNWWGETGRFLIRACSLMLNLLTSGEASDTTWFQGQLSNRWGYDEGRCGVQGFLIPFPGFWDGDYIIGCYCAWGRVMTRQPQRIMATKTTAPL